MELRGLLKRESFVDEVWVLESAGGSYQLIGDVPRGLEGKKVRVLGELAEAGFGFSMVGPIVEVRSIQAL